MRIKLLPAMCAILAILGCSSAGCADSQLKEMQQQVAQQKVLIEQQNKELEEFRVQQQQQALGRVPAPPGSCDNDVMHLALAHGDDQYAAGKYEVALGYYEDAARACPGKAQVELSLARAYEALGDRREARHHYQLALDSGQSDSGAADQARKGIARVGDRQ